MKRIKYKVWDKTIKAFISNTGNPNIFPFNGKIGMTCNGNATGHINTNRWVQDNYIIILYTGLKDKNGKEIYEGDICLDPKRKEGHKAVKIIWCDWMACYLISGKANWSENLHANIEDLEIIGNIYEHKHLLK